MRTTVVFAHIPYLFSHILCIREKNEQLGLSLLIQYQL